MANKDGSKSGGRKKGTPNRATQELIERLDELGCDPLELSAKIALGLELDGPHPGEPDFRAFVELLRDLAEKNQPIHEQLVEGLSILVDEHLMSGHVPIEIRSRHITDLMNYRFPKRAAVAVTDGDGDSLAPSCPTLSEEQALDLLRKNDLAT